jgi:hypothetical protein
VDEVLREHGFAEAVRGDDDDVFLLREKVEGEDALDGRTMELGRPGPFEIDQWLEAAEARITEPAFDPLWRRAASSACASCSSRTTGLQRFCVARAIRSLSSAAVWLSPSWRR